MFSHASKAWSNSASVVDYGEVSNPGWVSCIYWSRGRGRVTVGDEEGSSTWVPAQSYLSIAILITINK